MIRSFGQYRVWRDLREQGDPTGQGVGPGLGHVDGQPDMNDQDNQTGGPGEARQAFRDLSPVLERALTGPSGKVVINEMVNAIMNNDQVPDALKQELKAKIGAKWTNVIDLNQAPSPGKGQGLANNMNPSGGFGMDNMQQGSVNPTGMSGLGGSAG